MALAQTVVPVYTIPNTYRFQQSLWESICRIIPGIARTSGSELCSFEPVVPRNTPVWQANTQDSVVAGSSGDPRAGTARSSEPQNPAASLSTHKKIAAKEVHPAGAPVGIPPARSIWIPKEAFRNIPAVDLTGDGNPSGTGPQETSTPIKTAPAPDRSHSRKKLNISKIQAAHLLFKMQD